MRTKADYKLAIELVGSIIRKWDPYGLIAGRAPKNEFDAEIAQVVAKTSLMKSPEQAAAILREVFSKAFWQEDFPLSSCREAGLAIYNTLTEHGLLAIEGSQKRGPALKEPDAGTS